MLDFTNDEKRLEEAKLLMRQLQPTIIEEYLGEGKPLYLTFRGLQTFQYLNPTQAKVVYCDIKKDENFDVLKKITSKLLL